MTDERFAELFGECERLVEDLHHRCPFPLSDYDDLKQEMALALLECDGQTASFCLTRAAWAGVDWLRRTHGVRLACGVFACPDVARLVDRGAWQRVWA